MASEPDTLPTGGTDNAIPESDTAETWDYYDPDEDQDTVEAQPEGATEEGVGEEEKSEAPEDQPEDEATSEEEEADKEAGVEFIVKRADGTQTTVAELLKSEFRQADYTRKTQELSNDRKALEADLHRFEGISQAFIDHLSSMVPQEPSPALALTNPGKYTAEKAQYDAAVATVQKLIEIGSKPKEITDARTKEEHSKRIASENAKLADLYPETATKDGREKFFTDVAAAAAEVGFSQKEIASGIDHRLFALAKWAKIGMDADKARKEAKARAREKVEKAPPVTPRKPGQSTVKANGNAEAMRKLSRSGSIHDAVAVDWD